MTQFYTYIYYDPSRSNEPIYVGKGSKNRAWDHLKRKDHHPLTQRLQFMKKNNVLPIIGIYAGFDEELALLVEEELIAKFGRKDLGLGPLLNLTDGGEGTVGVKDSIETRKKKSIASSNRDNESKEIHRAAMRKVIKTNTHRENLSKSHMGKHKSDEHRLNLSKSQQSESPEKKKERADKFKETMKSKTPEQIAISKAKWHASRKLTKPTLTGA